MASDPVAEALRAAAQAIQSNCDIWDDDYARLIAAESVVAFLRALPKRSIWRPLDTPGGIANGFGSLAAAVERAAREGRDG